jgi:competence protein ComEC
VIGWFEQLPFAWVRVPGVSVWWAIASTIVLALIVTGRWRWKRPLSWIALLVVFLWGVLQPRLTAPTMPLRVVMLDVGDGSCVIVQSGNEAILWDCGSLDRRVGSAAGRALRTLGVTRLQRVLVTHDNLDHFNGLPDLMESVAIDEVRITARLRDDPSPSWVRVRGALEARGTSIRTLQRGDTLMVGSASMEILWPDPVLIDGYDDNDTSLVALLDPEPGADGSARLLLTGDIERDAMERLRALEPTLPERFAGGVMELPHHGSAREAAHGFVDWLRPGVIVQSTGPSRLDDDRWAAQRAGRDWYTTARSGAVVVEFGDDGRVETRYWFGR